MLVTKSLVRSGARIPALLLSVAAIAGGCNSTSDELTNGSKRGGDDDPSSAPTKFTCDPAQKPAAEQLRLLSTLQYTNTLRDLSAWALGNAASGAAVMREITPTIAQMQENIPAVPQANPILAALFPDGGYHREDQDQQLLRVQAYFAIGGAIGGALTRGDRLGAVVGSCATDGNGGNDTACLESFIRKFGARALRRPITNEDVAFYRGIYGASSAPDPAAYADVIAVMVNAPDFIYLVEHGDKPAGVAGTYGLTGYELASRLSYQLWDTMPDEALWSVGVDGSLLDDAVYNAQVDRLFGDARAAATFDRFFSDYLQVNADGGSRGKGGINYKNLAAYVGDPVFKSLAGKDLPKTSIAQSMLDDALGMIDYFVWTKPGTASDLLTSERSFAKSSELAAIYGAAPWDGNAEPPALPANQRPGLFTRAQVVSNGANTNPIMKGVYLRRYVLCDAIGKPPPAAVGATVETKENQTTRQAVAALTERAECAGCHVTSINPLGFATESFDGLGRFRTAQMLFHEDGSPAGSLPIDTSSIPRIAGSSDETPAGGIRDVMKLVSESGKFEACLTRNYFRYAFARFEDVKGDGCTLEAMRKKLDRAEGPGLLVDWLKEVVLTPAFKQRTFE